MGHHNRHFAGDRHALKGAWSPPTSSANFCEEDYAVTIYMAEFISTLTNLAYVYFALRWMYGPGSRGPLHPKTDFMSVSLLILGVASFVFHATLKQSTQFADEMGMLGLGWALLQSIMTIPGRPAYNRGLNVVLATVFPLFGAFYIWTGKIIYHATAFGLIVVFIVLRGQYLFLFRRPAFPEEKAGGWKYRGRWAIGWMAVGYALWHVDLELCAELRAFREAIGLPWAWLFEFHGWWHVLTAVAADLTMTNLREVQEHLRGEEEKKKDE